MKLKKYRVISNPKGYTFFDGDALGKERYGFKSHNSGFKSPHWIMLLDKILDGEDSYAYLTIDSDSCVEVPDIEEMPTNTRPAFLSSNSTLLTAIGDKPSKITIEF